MDINGFLTLMLLVAIFGQYKNDTKNEKWTETLAHRYSSESFSPRAIQSNTGKTLHGFRWFFRNRLRPCRLDEK